MQVKFQGNPLTLEGTQVKVGDKAPDFTVLKNDLSPLSLKDMPGKKIISAVPSLDTGVCDLETRRFNEEAEKLNGVTVYTISMDLPFAQARWCGNNGIKNVITASDFKDREFSQAYGCYIKELGLLTRAVFGLDENNKIIYVEYCDEVTDEPNYDAVLDLYR
ncbi:MAG: thiol peroxidase [Filifactor alocis]|nr:thiol peroxidase [Filifactor alocis]